MNETHSSNNAESVDHSNIPGWLQSSDLYENASTAGLSLQREAFTSSEYMRPTTDIFKMTEFIEVMKCIDYWGVYCWPDSVYNFITGHIDDVKAWRNACEFGVCQHLDISDAILDIISNIGSHFLQQVGELGSLGWLKFGYSKGLHWTRGSSAFGGHLCCLEYAINHGCPWNVLTCANAAGGGHLSCLRYAHENGCPWNESTCAAAAYHGHLSCLEYADMHHCPWDEEVVLNAARRGHLQCLMYAVSRRCPCPEGLDACSAAAAGGQLSCLQYVHECGFAWGEETCCYAARGGHLSCLQYAREHNCPWDDSVLAVAEDGGHQECVQYYLLQHSIPMWNEISAISTMQLQ